MVVLAGDMNGHVGSSNVGYDGTHGGHRSCPQVQHTYERVVFIS